MRYFPKPYPDESLYSVCARLKVHLQESSHKRLMDELFGRAEACATFDLPHRMDLLCERVAQVLGIETRILVTHHTLLPYYCAYRTKDERRRTADALTHSDYGHLHVRLGINSSIVKRPQKLRYCPACWKEQLLTYGECFWSRLFVLPGVFLCPDHRRVLREVAVPVRTLNRHSFLSPVEVQDLPTRAISRPSRDDEPLLLRIAERSRAVLDGETAWLPTGYGYREALTARAFWVGKIRQRDVEKAFVDCAPHRLLKLLDLDFAEGRDTNWVRAISRKQRKALHPLQHIVFQLFLDQLPPAPLLPAFGTGPWPCPNWLAPHYGECCVKKLDLFRRKDGTRMGRFSCECGLVFTRVEGADTNAQARPARVIEWGRYFGEEAIRLRGKGWATRRIATRLGIDWKTVDRLLRATSSKINRPVRSDTRIAVNQGGRNPRVVTARKDEAKRRERVDWAQRDRALLRTLKHEAKQAASLRPVVRVTATNLAKRADAVNLIPKQLGKLPCTRRFLLHECETTERFQLRRLREVADTLRVKEGRVRSWELLRAAAIPTERLTPATRLLVSRLSR